MAGPHKVSGLLLRKGNAWEYDPNDIDLLRVKQKNPQSPTGYDVLTTNTYRPTDPPHLPATVTDAFGQTTTYTYRANGDVETMVTPERDNLSLAERTTTFAYYPDDAPLGAGRLQRITGPLPGAITSYTYDGFGRVRTATDSDSYTLTTDYDAMDRPTKTTYPDGTFEEIVYNRLDADRHRDRLGRWSHRFHDALRRVAATQDPLGRTITQVWCTCGSLDKLIDGNGNSTTWERDLQGRVKKEIRADGSVTEFTYEQTTSRLKEVKDPKQQVKRYEYFVDNNKKQIAYINAEHPTPNVSFTYDASYERLSTMTDGTGQTMYSYYPVTAPPQLGAGKLMSVDGPGANDTVTYGYDEMGRRVRRAIDGVTTTRGFDALGRVSTIGHPAGTFTYGHVGATGRRASLSYPNGTSATYSYLSGTSDRQLREIHHKFPGETTLAKFNYTYDVVGNIKSWQQQDEANPAKIYDLGYDAADRLTSAVYRTTDPTPMVLKRYGSTYDPAGNRTSDQIDDVPLQGTYNNMDRLLSQQPGGALTFAGSTNEPAKVTVQSKPATTTSDNRFLGSAQVNSGTTQVAVVATDPSGNVRTNTYEVNITGATKTYSYDANGNLTQKVDGNTWVNEWYADDRLARVTKDSVEVARFVYDGFGRRQQKIAGGATTTYTYDEERILREDVSTGTTYRYVHGPTMDEPLARQDQGGAAVFYHADHLGSIVKVTNGVGATVTTRRYEPYGNLEANVGESGYAFTGREWDTETGLYYYRARYYDPKVGRFISEDPIGFNGGINPYAYVGNNPTNLVDPLGLFPKPLRWPNARTRDCNPVELAACEAICLSQGKGLESCKVSQTFRLVRGVDRKGVWWEERMWVDGPMSCSCTEPEKPPQIPITPPATYVCPAFIILAPVLCFALPCLCPDPELKQILCPGGGTTST